MTDSVPLTDAELEAISARVDVATAGPWFVRHLDDEYAMGMTAVGTHPDTGLGERFPDFDPRQIVAATLVQQPRYVDVDDDRALANAIFIAAARSDVPRLVAEIQRLRSLLES